jgi:hypothetical protein
MGNIDWIPIADMPDALKDGREVLLWVSHGFPAVYKWRGRFWWNMEDVRHYVANAPRQRRTSSLVMPSSPPPMWGARACL